MANDVLDGDRFAILVTDGFEQVELLQPRHRSATLWVHLGTLEFLILLVDPGGESLGGRAVVIQDPLTA